MPILCDISAIFVSNFRGEWNKEDIYRAGGMDSKLPPLRPQQICVKPRENINSWTQSA